MTTEGRISKGMAILVMMALGACGGGGGSAPPAVTTPPPTGGITGTGAAVSIGTISGFGSVIVNGVEYDTSSANFTVDGQAADQSVLKIGQVVFVRGTIDDDNTNAVAETVEYDDVIEGPVTQVLDEFTILVLGSQTVHTADAIFDDSCQLSVLTDLLVFPAVEVSGSVLGDGSIVATYIECKTVAGELELTGVVAADSLGDDTFLINQVVVNFTDFPAAIDNFPTPGMISEGDPVEVKGNDVVDGELVATRVEYKGARFAGEDGDHFEIEGHITSFTSSRSFGIVPFQVTSDDDTTYEGGTEDDVGLGIKVEVEGERDGNSIHATKIEFKRGTAVRLSGLVDSASGGSSFVMLSITVTTQDGETRFDDKTGMVPDEQFGASDIMQGNFLEVRGQEFPAGSDELFAVIVERDDAADFQADENILQGFVEDAAIAQPNLTVLGVTIATVSGMTQYENQNDQPISESDFWGDSMQPGLVQPGSLIKAKGTFDGTTLTAEEVELQME